MLAVIALIVYFFFFTGAPQNQPPQAMPQSIAYALEYFNAVNSNKTIIVPSAYYPYAEALAINNNRVIENDTEYARILLNDSHYAGVDYVLIDMAQLNNMSALFEKAGVHAAWNVTEFNKTYYIANLSTGANKTYRNCFVYGNATDVFDECQLFVSSLRIGDVALASFPRSSTICSINASIFYNGVNSTYIPSVASPNSTCFERGLMFVYQGVAAFYMSPSISQTFYGREMFMPYNMLRNVLDNYGEARVVSLN